MDNSDLYADCYLEMVSGLIVCVSSGVVKQYLGSYTIITTALLLETARALALSQLANARAADARGCHDWMCSHGSQLQTWQPAADSVPGLI